MVCWKKEEHLARKRQLDTGRSMVEAGGYDSPKIWWSDVLKTVLDGGMGVGGEVGCIVRP